MKIQHKEMIGRILLGIVILSILSIVILPKPNFFSNPVKQESITPPKKKVVQHVIRLTKSGFEPQEITIKKNEVITWTNVSGKDASVNSADHPTHRRFPILNLGQFSNDQSVQVRLTDKGDFNYVNHLTPSQKGTIKVTD